jgi:hypothetical protein
MGDAMGKARRSLPIAATLALTLASAAPASAAQRYTSPGGTAANPCTQAAPCDIVTAINGGVGNMPVAKDEVIVEPGSYYKLGTASTPLSTDLAPQVDESIHGVVGQPRPVIFSAASPNALELNGLSTMSGRFLDIEQSASVDAVYISNANADQLFVHATKLGACYTADGTTLTNSICWGNTTGVFESAASPGPFSATFRNVDSYATGGPGTYGIQISGSSNSMFTLHATNVIARGGGGAGSFDVYGNPASGSSVTINLDHSDYVTTHAGPNGMTTITPPGGATNITTDPALVSPSTGDFHETASSATIDKGATSALNGSFDFEGQPRVEGGLTDIGADEFVALPVVTAGAASAITMGGATVGGTVNPGHDTTSYVFKYGLTPALASATPAQSVAPGFATRTVSGMLSSLQPGKLYYWQLVATNSAGAAPTPTQSFTTIAMPAPVALAPSLAGLAVVPSSFVADTSGATITKVHAKKKKKKKTKTGAVIAYTDSQAATTAFTVQRQSAGVLSGKQCVAPPHKKTHKHQTHCPRVIMLGGFTHADLAGANRLHFSGRIGGHKLAAGLYTLIATARNAAGLSSAPRSAGFRIKP